MKNQETPMRGLGLAARIVLFVALALIGSAGIYWYATAIKGGITTGFEPNSIVELDQRKAQTVFNPDLDNLQPKPFYVLICDGNDLFCRKQLKESDKLAKLLGDDVLFYHLDPAMQESVYNVVKKVMDQLADEPIPQSFPMHTLWTTGFRFQGTEPHAGVALVNLDKDMLPAGGLLQWVKKSLNPPKKGEHTDHDQQDRQDPQAGPKTKAAPKVKPDAAQAEPTKGNGETEPKAPDAINVEPAKPDPAEVLRPKAPGVEVQPAAPAKRGQVAPD